MQVQEAIKNLVQAVREETLNTVRTKIFGSLGQTPSSDPDHGDRESVLGARPTNGSNGHHPQVAKQAAKLVEKPARKKPPLQLCPAPGCSNRAAPAFKMLCAQHKNAPKASVKKWRESRMAAKAKLAMRHLSKPAAKK